MEEHNETDLFKQVKGMNWNIHQNNKRLDKIFYLLEEILDELKRK